MNKKFHVFLYLSTIIILYCSIIGLLFLNKNNVVDTLLTKYEQKLLQESKTISKVLTELLNSEENNNSDFTHLFLLELEKQMNITNTLVIDTQGNIITYTHSKIFDYQILKPNIKKELSNQKIQLLRIDKNKGFFYQNIAIPIIFNKQFYIVMIQIQSQDLLIIDNIKKQHFFIIFIVSILFLTFLFISLFQNQKIVKIEKQQEQDQRLIVMGEMSASIAHEIKNPLGIIRSSTQIIEKKYPKEKQLFEFIYEEIDNLNHNINDYLTFSKDITINPKQINLAKIIDHNLQKVAQVNLVGNFNITIYYDAFRLNQIIGNLLFNAQKYGKPPFTIEVAKTEQWIQLMFLDMGQGIPQKDLDYIFKAFHTTSKSGTGLGLAICQRIAKLHDGFITAENLPKQGVKFTLHIKNL